MDETLRAELLRMQAEDLETRERLVSARRLPRAGYAPEMKEVHLRNNARVRAIVERHGWPGRSLVGEDGGDAAWLLVQHAVLEPELQRRCVPLLEEAVRAGEAPAWQLAYLLDRVLMAEGRPQVYGTQYVPAADGKSVVLWEVQDPAGVDARRHEVGLDSTAENGERIRREDALSAEGEEAAPAEEEEITPAAE